MTPNHSTLNRVLIIRPSALGDVARSICLAASIKQSYPSCTIDWLVQKGFETVLEASPHIDRLILFDRKALSIPRMLKSPSWWRSLHSLTKEIRRHKYDAVIDAQGLTRSAIFAKLARTNIRVGYNTPQERIGFLYTHKPSQSEPRHTVDKMLSLLQCLKINPSNDLSLTVPSLGIQEVQQLEDHWLSGESTLIVCAPTSRWGSKRWPAERWTSLLRSLLELDPSCNIAIIGGPGETKQCEPLLNHFATHPRVRNCIGSLSLAGTMAVISQAKLVLAGDSAPLHIAVGLNRTIIALFGPTDPTLVGPYKRDDSVIRPGGIPPGNSHRDLGEDDSVMQRIPVSTVLDMCKHKLETTTATSKCQRVESHA